MAAAAKALHDQAIRLYAPEQRRAAPWEELRRVQQQLLTRLLVRALTEKKQRLAFTPGDVSDWYGVSPNTAREWLERWRTEGFVRPENAQAQRVRAYQLAAKWEELVVGAIRSNRDSDG